MALFERPTHSHFTALLRQGFAARLRSETADIYLSQRENSLTLTNHREKASVFFFCGGDGPLTAILVRPPEEGDPKFLSIAKNVTLTDNPTLLKLTLSNTSRQLFSVSRVAPTSYLSLHHVSVNSAVNSRPTLSKWELFHLEVIPGTIGRGFVAGPFPNTKYINLSQAISHALLELGVRFRLRSVHDRVLRTRDNLICQDGPQTLIASTHDDELLATAFRYSENNPDAFCADYALEDVASGHFLSLLRSEAKLAKDKKMLCVRASPNGWGKLSVGVKDGNAAQWLMAGPRGRLETRRTPGAWEKFTLEFVRQSYDAAIRELPVPGIYKAAETATRENLRQEVEARVAAARKTTVQSREKSSGKKTFDHSKALAGLSDPIPETTEKPKQDKRKKTAASNQAPGSTTSKTAGGPKVGGSKGVRSTVSGSALPRNKASRKNSKKNRKKQKQKSASRGEPSTNLSKKGSQSNPRKAASPKAESDTTSQGAGSKAEADPKLDVEPSPPAGQVESARGPPCAACGRPLVGTYTTALGKSFHAECFCCGRCRRPMGVGAGQFRERGGIPYCTSCYAAHLASRCARCSQPIMDTVITAMEKTWHKDCLTCTICRLPLTQTFWLYADKPNEPRCSRCVTGDENYTSSGGSRRMVNLPMFGRSNKAPSFPLSGPTSGSGVVGGSSTGGRARLVTPVLPPTTRR